MLVFSSENGFQWARFFQSIAHKFTQGQCVSTTTTTTKPIHSVAVKRPFILFIIGKTSNTESSTIKLYTVFLNSVNHQTKALNMKLKWFYKIVLNSRFGCVCVSLFLGSANNKAVFCLFLSLIHSLSVISSFVLLLIWRHGV